MGNILDGARSNFRTFDELPFNAVDSLTLSELAYIHMPESVPRHETTTTVRCVPMTATLRAEDYPSMVTTGSQSVNEYRLNLLRAVCESPRYRGMRVGEYAERLDADDQTQFAAMTFDLSDCAGMRADAGGTLYVAFRGTDNTLVGWKEDFNMAVRCPVPAQRAAAAYLRSVADRSTGALGSSPATIMVGGHSKGGNMAIYAAMLLGTSQPRVTRIFSHDGPGFDAAVTRSDAYRAVCGRIDKTVPESSVIGMLLDDGDVAHTVVKADAIGILQHMGGSWQVADGEFVTAPELTVGAQFADRTIGAWLDGVDQRQREITIDQTYDVIAAAGYDNFADLAANWTDALPKILVAASGTDRKTRELISSVLKGLPSSAVRTLVRRDETV